MFSTCSTLETFLPLFSFGIYIKAALLVYTNIYRQGIVKHSKRFSLFHQHHTSISTPVTTCIFTSPSIRNASIQGGRYGELQTCWWYDPLSIQYICTHTRGISWSKQQERIPRPTKASVSFVRRWQVVAPPRTTSRATKLRIWTLTRVHLLRRATLRDRRSSRVSTYVDIINQN